jgi:hypothetical protein
MRVRVKKGNQRAFKKAMLARADALQKITGRAIAEGLKGEVLKRARLRSADGSYAMSTEWIKLYREAIRFLESKDGRRWAVAGVSATKLTTTPAESTQIKFMDGGGRINDVVRPYIWTVDTLPAITGGYSGDVIVRPASEAEMTAHRETIRPELPRIVEQLESAGAQVIDGFPAVNGTVLMDLKFLQLRLEHGLGGFARSPHWKPSARQAANKGREWVAAKGAEIKKALKTGEVPEPDHLMSDSLEKLLERVRKTSWT